MATTPEDYDRKFAEMQKYIPFLENMIDRLKNVDKPRAPQLDKIQSLYNIVTNSKKKLKYETLIKCEEGLKKLYEKVGKADTTTKPLVDNRQSIQPVKQNFDCSSAPASPSPPSTPDPAPKAPILIPTERRLSPIRNLKPLIERPIEHKHSKDRDPKKNRHHESSSSSHKHRHRTKSIDDGKWRSGSETKDDSFGIYSKGILNPKKEEPVISPPLNEPPLTSDDIADLLSENAVDKNEEQLDIEKLENIRAQLVNQIKDLSGGNSPNVDEDVSKKSKIIEKKKDEKQEEKPHTTSKTTTVKETENKTKPKITVVEKKEVENKFGSLLSSIDEQIFEKNKEQKKEVKVKIDKDKEKSQTKPTETEKPIQKKDEEVKKIEEVKNVDDLKKVKEEEVKKVEEEKKIENDKPEQTYVRLADKYQRKPRSDKPVNDVHSDDSQTYQEKAPGNITGRGLTMKELERFGGGFEPQQQMSNFSPPHHNSNPNIITYPNDPRLKRLSPQTHNVSSWMHQQQSHINQPAANQNSQMYPQDIYSPGPPSTPSDPFNTPKNMYNNIQIPLQETFPQPLYNQNKNFHQFNQNLSNQYDLSKMNPINYYENPNQYHTNHKPGLLGPAPPGYNQKIPLLSPPQNQSPLYNNQNVYNVQTIPSLLTGAKGPPRPLNRDPRDLRDHRDIRDHRDARDHRDSRDSRDSRDFRDSRDPRDPRDPRRARFDSNIRSETTDRYNQNRNTINNRPPEKKVFRGYDPRPQPRPKKEPERKTIDGISNIPTPGALNSFKIPKLKREEIIEEKLENVDIPEPDTSMAEPEKTNETDNEIDKSGNTATQNPEISTSNSNENETESKESKELKESKESKESKEPKTSETKVDSKEDLINNFVRKLCESGETDTFLAVLERLGETISKTRMKRIIRNSESDESGDDDKKSKTKEETKKPKGETENVEQPSDKKIKSKASKAPTEKSSDKPSKMKRRNDLEMLQDDIRDMFICEGVLTATGQRMCRLLNEDEDKEKEGEEVKNFPSLRKLRSGKDIISEEDVSPSRRTRVTRQSKSLPDTPPLELPTRTRNRVPRVVIEKSNLETIKPRTSIDEKEVEKVVKQQRKSVKKVGSFEETTTDVNLRNLFLKRNLKGGKKCASRRRIILKTKIYNVIKKLIKLKKLKIDERKTLKSIFENNHVEEKQTTVKCNTKTVTALAKPAAVKTLGVKLGKRKGRRGKAWSTGVIKRKVKKSETEAEKDKEKETDEVINVKSEMDNTVSAINYPDKEYCFRGPGKYNCKLCAFSGKSIILHYRSAHPSDEIMISRLHLDSAKICIDESIKNDYDSLKQTEETINCAGFPRRKRFNGFKCRFCDITINNEFTKAFYSHIVAHTGEYSFGCSHCKFTTISKPSLRTHVSHSHPGKRFDLIQFYPTCKNYTILLGYLCGECNFVQLHEENVEKHVKRYHADKLVRIYKINMSSIATEAVENKSELARLKKEMGEKQNSVDDETMDVDVGVSEGKLSKEEIEKSSSKDNLSFDKSSTEDTEISFSDQSISPDKSSDEEKLLEKFSTKEKPLKNTSEEKKSIEKISSEKKSIEQSSGDEKSIEKSSAEENTVDKPFAEEKSIEEKYSTEEKLIQKPSAEKKSIGKIAKEEKSVEKPSKEKTNLEKYSSKEKPLENYSSKLVSDETKLESNSVLNVDENKDQPQKERELNVFVCPDELLDEQKIQDERLKIMQEVAEAVCQTRRTSFQFLDTLKLRLESSEESEENNEIAPSTPEVSSTTKNSDDTLKFLDTLKSKLDKQNTENVSIEEKIDNKESNSKSPNSIEDIPQIFDNDDDLDNSLIDEVLNMENDWSKWSTGKTNSAMMNTIQRLANAVKQGNDPAAILPTAETVKYHVGPVTAEKTGDALQYFCSSNACKFSSDDKEVFTAHVLDKHLDFWDGECNKCDMNIQQNDVKLTCKDALDHLFIFHLELSTGEKVDEASVTNKPVIRMRRLSGDKLSMSPDIDRSNITDTDSNTSNDLVIKNLVSFSEPTDGLEFKIQDVRTLNPDEVETTSIKTEQKTPTKTIYALSPIKTLSPGTSLLKTVPLLIKTGASPKNASPQQKLSPKIITKRLYINKQMACKDPKTVQKMLEPTKLAHIFKCMAKMCTFSTDEANTFLWHLNTVKTPLHMNEKDWGTCPYCSEPNITSAKRLEQHILHEHGECRFQCGYCFYRAASQTLVERHQCEHHGSENFRVYQLEPRGDYNEYKKQMPLKLICKPYICPLDNCKVEIYLRENFVEHVEQHADMDMYACQLCPEKRETMLALIQHYTKHNIGFIQCLYCASCAEYEHTMKDHLGKRHPNQSPKVLFRKINPALKTVLKIREPINSESILRHLFICNLDLKTTHFSTAIPIPSTPFNFTPDTSTETNPPPLTAISSSTTSATPSSATTSGTPFSDNLLLLLNENETNNTTNSTTKENFETNLEDENSHLNELIESTLKETENDGKQPDLDLFKDNITENSKELDIPLVVELENSDEDDVTNQVDPLALDDEPKDKIESKDNPKNDADNENPKQLVNSLDDIQSTGLNGKALYRCGTPGCDHASETLASFKDHLFICDTSQDSSMFRCFHCKKLIKYLTSLVDHIKRHGLARYGCSLCNYRSSIASTVAKHMKDRHKITQVRTIPLDPFKADLENDLFVVCPQGKSTSTLKRKSSNRDMDRTAPQVETKMVFAPNEVDLLPRQPISPFDMKCAQCSYATKVRTNMVRHLLFHSNSIAVPESAPVNPVPCLEKNEKMFDKMVNLANSSFSESSRMGGKQTRKSSISNEDLQDLPGFVPENKRFVCGANGCNYLTVDDSMLRCHFRALHMDEINYKCPHCPEHLGAVISIDKIGIHLKMHDTRLYKCSHCSYYHYQKYVVERHLGEKHSDKVPYVHVIRELDADGNDERKDNAETITTNDAALTQAVGDGKPWRCGLCKMRTVTRTEIIDHAKTAHSVKSQFMCSLCQYRCSYDKGFEKHFNSKHSGQPVDMISVYYKDDTPSIESSVPGANSSAAEVFDTTPLWRRDMPRIRHIRGILFEETQTKQTSPRKSAKTTPVVNDEYVDVEYLEEDFDSTEYVKKTTSKRRKSTTATPTVRVIKDSLYAGEESTEVKHYERKEDLDSKKLELNITYSCSICNKFTATARKEIAEHLCEEMNYEKFICTYCSKRSHSFDWMKSHLEIAHGKPWKPEFIVSLTVDENIESFILNEINRQEKESGETEKVSNYVQLENLKDIFGFPSENRHKNTDLNSSTSSSAPTSSSTALGEGMQYPEEDSEYEEIDQTNNDSSSMHKIKDLTSGEEFFVDPRQTDRNKCPHCSYFSKYPRDVTKHIIRHWEEQPYQCGYCDVKGTTIIEIVKHNSLRHKIKCKVIKLIDPKDIKTRPMKIGNRRKTIDPGENSPQIKKVAVEAPPKNPPEVKKIVLQTTPKKEDQEEDIKPPILENETEKDIPSTSLPEPTVDPKEPVVYLCHYCPKQSDTVKAIYDHWQATHKERFSKGSFKFRTFGKSQIPPRVRGRVLCKICGYRGSKQNVLKHHKQMHAGQQLQIDETTPPPSSSDGAASAVKPTRINCKNCLFYCYSLVAMEEHYIKVHNNANLFKTQFAEELGKQEEVSKKPNASAVQCKWCQEICKDEAAAKEHHVLFHSHLKLSVTPVAKPGCVKYSCPNCSHKSESYMSIIEHFRSHVKPFVCGYCDVGFSFPHHVKIHTVKKHTGLEPKYEAIEKLQQELTELRNNLMIILEDGTKMLYNEYKSSKRKSEEDPTGSSSINKIMKMDVVKKSPVAKKSTTFVPKPRILQVARKSTTPHVNSIPSPSPSMELVKENEDEDKDKYYSFYGKKPITDNSRITTTMNLGGTQMKVNISTLMQLTNMLPVLRIADLKNQRMIL